MGGQDLGFRGGSVGASGAGRSDLAGGSAGEYGGSRDVSLTEPLHKAMAVAPPTPDRPRNGRPKDGGGKPGDGADEPVDSGALFLTPKSAKAERAASPAAGFVCLYLERHIVPSIDWGEVEATATKRGETKIAAWIAQALKRRERQQQRKK